MDDDISSDNIIKRVYMDCWGEQTWNNKDDIGFYGIIKFDDGRTVEPNDYITVWSSRAEKLDDIDNPEIDHYEKYRLILVGQDFISDDKHLWNAEINAMCDRTFITDGTFSYHDYGQTEPVEYTIGRNELATDTVPVSEWTGSEEIELTYHKFAGTESERKLNSEAKDRLMAAISKLENAEYTSTAQESLKDSFCIDYKRFDQAGADVYAIYVYHPIRTAVKDHLLTYIIGALVLAVAEAIAVIIMRKMYGNRMSYELMRQDLTRSIAHDLKTPLAITKAYTENWEYIDEEDRPEYAEKLNTEVDNMAAMINNMLSMSKLESEGSELRLEEVELYSVASAIYEKMKPIIEERGLKVKLITDVIGGKYCVSADPKMIKIVIGNFITNAIKYADTRVEIKLLGNDKKVKFMVSNDGEGISKKDIKKIWEPFYKGDKARTDRLGSSGMGLAINRSILRLHKAKYKCISDKCETSFWFEMKRVK